MIEELYDLVENHESKEPQTVMDFLSRFAKDGDTEELFLAAVRDTKFAGFKEGVKATIALLREAS